MSLPRAAYGTWKSPINAADIAKMDLSVEDLIVDPKTSKSYIVEKRPSEGGRNVVVSLEDKADLFGKNWNARTNIHEFGGAPAVIYDGVLYFSNISDGRVYQVEVGKNPIAITPKNSNHRLGDFAVNPRDPRWLAGILEDHTDNAPSRVKNTLVAVDVLNYRTITLASGHDFYSNPRFSQDGKLLAWKQWDHPDAPWEGSQIFVASCLITASEDGDTSTLKLGTPFLIAGQPAYISVAEPSWTPSNELLFLSDINGYLNPWIASHCSEGVMAEPVSPLHIPEDFGELDWVLGLSSYALLDDKNAIYSSFRNGRAQMYLVHLDKRTFRALPTPYVSIQFVRHVSKGKVVFWGKKSDDEGVVVELELDDPEDVPQYRVIQRQDRHNNQLFPSSLISLPQAIQIRVLIENYRLPVHVVYYPPKNPNYLGGLSGELPPAIVHVHGGPTCMVGQGLDWQKQYFTSRGWTWVDLNYSGSSNYGRDYRERLVGSWGIFDVNDAADTVSQLGKRGLIDPKRTVIRGESAGGFTALATLSTRPEAFAAGTALFGVSDLVTLQRAMPKFQSHYLKRLIGGGPDEAQYLWKGRSPLTNAANIKVPLLLLQGGMDSIVPVVQAEVMVKVIEANGGQVKYVLFENEGHGWRLAETVQRALEEELAFYQRVLGLEIDD